MDADLISVKSELRRAVPALSNRGLYFSARWVAQLLNEIDVPDEELPKPPAEELEDEALLAKAYFDMREYRRAAHALPQSCKSPFALFLRCYCVFMAGEKQKEEEAQEKASPVLRAKVVNRQLHTLCSELGERFEKGELDGFCTFLYGVVLKDLSRTAEAMTALIRSVNIFPCNWSAWKAIAALCKDRKMVQAVSETIDTRHWMWQFFLADVFLELHLHQNEEAIQLLERLAARFPKSSHITAQRAMAFYGNKNFESSTHV